MKALCWFGKHDVRVENVSDPQILNSRDAIIRITSTAICGSDLHLYNGYIPTMEPGDVLGHEFMGEVVEVGASITNLKVGDRVVVPFTISCGGCATRRRNLSFMRSCQVRLTLGTPRFHSGRWRPRTRSGAFSNGAPAGITGCTARTATAVRTARGPDDQPGTASWPR